MGLHRPRIVPKGGDRRGQKSGVGPDGGLENEPHQTRAGRQATGILKLKRAGPWRPAPLLFDSAKTFARDARGIASAPLSVLDRGPPSEISRAVATLPLRG